MALSAEAMAQPPIFALVAGETSGDQLGADLIGALKATYPNARFVGIGGPLMMAQGLDSWYPMARLSVMGLFEVLRHLPGLLRLRHQLIQALVQCKPTAFIGIDAPDFNLTVAQKLKAQGIPSFHYVGPSVWAWREKRLQTLRKQINGIFLLFPFEAPLYKRYHIPFEVVGHPLAHPVAKAPSLTSARHSLGLASTALITGLLPGSRRSEVTRMFPVYVQAALLLQRQSPQMQFVIAAATPALFDWMQGHLALLAPADRSCFHLVQGQADTVIAASDQLIVTSGTATLQTALMQKPFVLSIRVHPVSYYLMKKMARTDWIGLPNVLAQATVVPELIQSQATPQAIVNALKPLIDDPAARAQQVRVFAQQKQQLALPSAQLAVARLRQWLGY